MRWPIFTLASLAIAATTSFAQQQERPEGEAAAPPAADAPVLAAPALAAPASETPTPDARLLNPLAGLDKATLDGFREMPLFTPSRKRPAPPAAEPAEEAPPPPEPKQAAPAPPPELKLSGVIEGPEGAVAVVQDAGSGGKVERLRLGDQIGGWLVTGIEPAALKLTLAERDEEYRLFQRSDASAKGPDAVAKETDPDDPDL